MLKYREQEHWAVQVAAGKALVLKDDRLLRCGIAIVGADIFAAEVDLLLRLCPDDEDTIYQIVDLLVDTCFTKRKMLRIAGDDKPTEVVRSRLKKLNADHIRFVLDSLAENTAPVRNMKQYLLAMLYNAPTTMNLYYQNKTNHDFARGSPKAG